MPVHFPEEATSPAEQRWLVFNDLLFGRGWQRYLPPASILIAGALASDGPMTKDALRDEWVRTGHQDGERGWEADPWDPVKVWTDEEWQEAKREAEDGPFAYGPDSPPDAAGANAAEIEEHEWQLARSDGYARALGLEPVGTMGGVLDYMLAAGVVVQRQEDGRVVYALNPDVGLPSEVLPLSEEDRAAEDSLRWRDVHESTAQAIIRLFQPDGEEPLDRKRTSLTRLARELDSDFESARAGVLNLLQEGDFTATIESRTPRRIRSSSWSSTGSASTAPASPCDSPGVVATTRRASPLSWLPAAVLRCRPVRLPGSARRRLPWSALRRPS
jgi:hypothetical protein